MALVRVTTAEDTFEFPDATYDDGEDLKVFRPDGRLWSHFPKGSYALEVVGPKPAKVKAEATPKAAPEKAPATS